MNEEQQLSQEMLKQEGPRLAREAASLLEEHPQAEPVGLIVEARASEAGDLRRMFQPPEDAAEQSFSGIVPRDLAKQILAANHPATLDWLADARRPDGSMVLPLVAITENGAQLGQVGIELG